MAHDARVKGTMSSTHRPMRRLRRAALALAIGALCAGGDASAAPEPGAAQ